MNMREHFDIFRYLMEKHCMLQEDIVFVDDIPKWCRDYGIPEDDKQKPLKLILKNGQGCKLLVKENVPDDEIDKRINATRIRGQVTNAADSKADMLDSLQRKLAFLFLNEYAYSLPEVKDDLLADEWAFTEMERLGYFRTEKER